MLGFKGLNIRSTSSTTRHNLSYICNIRCFPPWACFHGPRSLVPLAESWQHAGLHTSSMRTDRGVLSLRQCARRSTHLQHCLLWLSAPLTDRRLNLPGTTARHSLLFIPALGSPTRSDPTNRTEIVQFIIISDFLHSLGCSDAHAYSESVFERCVRACPRAQRCVCVCVLLYLWGPNVSTSIVGFEK